MASRYLTEIPLHPSLPKILDPLIKAILKKQPSNIIQFCAEYFDKLQNGGKPNGQNINNNKSELQNDFIIFFGQRVDGFNIQQIIKFVQYFNNKLCSQTQIYPNNIQNILHKLNEKKKQGKLIKRQIIQTMMQISQ